MRAVFLVVLAFLSLGNGKDTLKLLPPDAQMVIAIDLKGARGAATYDRVIAAIGDDKLAALTSAGIDLDKDVDRIVVGGSEDAPVLVVDGRFKKLKKGAAKKHRGVTYWVDGDGELMLIGKKRLVAVKAGGIKAVIDRMKKKAPSLASDDAGALLRAVIDTTDTSRHLWVVVGGALFADKGLQLDALSIAASFGAAVDVQARAVFPDEPSARQLEGVAQAQWSQLTAALGQFGMAATAKSMTLSRTGQVLQVDAAIPEAELETLFNLGSMF